MHARDYPTQMYYLTKENVEKVKQSSLEPPVGYTLTSVQAEDVDEVVSNWRHAGTGDKELTA